MEVECLKMGLFQDDENNGNSCYHKNIVRQKGSSLSHFSLILSLTDFNSEAVSIVSQALKAQNLTLQISEVMSVVQKGVSHCRKAFGSSQGLMYSLPEQSNHMKLSLGSLQH